MRQLLVCWELMFQNACNFKRLKSKDILVNTPKSYFFRSFLIILMAACFFLGLKEVLPKRIFVASKGPAKSVLIDSMLIDAFESESDSMIVTPNDTLANQRIVFEEALGVTFPEERMENYKGYQLESKLRCDLFIENSLVVELKSVNEISPIF